VVTDGFYEWKKPEKQPYAVAMAGDEMMVMAGLLNEWKAPQRADQELHDHNLPTNAIAGALHDRMPVILEGLGEVAG
jgi:putative SOS response-associated peptidase YedK